MGFTVEFIANPLRIFRILNTFARKKKEIEILKLEIIQNVFDFFVI